MNFPYQYFKVGATPTNPYPCKLRPYPHPHNLMSVVKRIPERSGSRLEVVSLQFTGIFVLNTYLFLLMVSPETIYLYVVYVNLEMIENQCPLRLTCNRPRDLRFQRFEFCSQQKMPASRPSTSKSSYKLRS